MLAAPSNADVLDKSVTGMLANVTQPQSISTNMGGGFVGGSLYLRTPNSSISILNIDAPRFSAGCGGIDATLGGFSYISAQKLMDFFRKVIQQAIPLAFQLALCQMNGQICTALKDFQTWAQKMSHMLQNSCSLATGIAQGATGAQTNQTNSLSSLWQATQGLVTDVGQALDNLTTNPSAGIDAMLNNSPKNNNGKTNLAATSDCQVGNQTWEALKAQQANYSMVFGLDASEDMSKQILMSLIGTKVITNPDPTNDSNAPKIINFSQGTIGIQDLIAKRPEGTISILECGDTDLCGDPHTVDEPYFGIEGYINNQLFGTKDPSGVSGQPSGVQTGSIVDLMINGTPASSTDATSILTTDQKNFVSAVSRVPVLGYLQHVQHDPQQLQYVAESLVPILVNQLSVVYGDQIIRLTRSAFNGSSCKKPDLYDDKLRSVEKMVAATRAKLPDDEKRLQDLLLGIDNTIRNNAQLKIWSAVTPAR
jgi:conjugative transfer pilus assembly protein TraH